MCYAIDKFKLDITSMKYDYLCTFSSENKTLDNKKDLNR